MISRLSDRLIFAALLLLLLGVAVISFLGGAARQGQDEQQGSSLSPAQPGTLALYLWLESAGYPVRRITGGGEYADALRDTDLLFVLNPQTDFTPLEIAGLDAWMQAGGVLVLSAEGTNALAAHLGADLSPLLPPVAGPLIPRQPAWTSPPVRRVGVDASSQLNLSGDDAVPLLTAGTGTLIAEQPRGRGRLVIASTTWQFTNAGIRAEDNRWLAWNLAALGSGRRIAFDEIHHGFTGGDLRQLLLSTPWGLALLYAGLVIVLGILLTGRRLGPPIAVPAASARRGAGEYMAALAGLFMRAGRTDWAADRYRAEFRRAIAAPYGLDAAAPPDDLAAAFAAAHHRAVDAPALAGLLADLDAAAAPGPHGRATVAAPALLRLVRRAEALRSEIFAREFADDRNKPA
ncbi:MAG: DUF4350 domain-containing protein [Chloroflexia bacterium]